MICVVIPPLFTGSAQSYRASRSEIYHRDKSGFIDSEDFKKQAQGPSVLLARCSAHSRQNRARMGALTCARSLNGRSG